MKILVVEDDFTSRLLLGEDILKGCGTVHLAVDGQEAVAACRQALAEGFPYRLICLDIMMPGMDGQKALAEIRAAEEAHGMLSSAGAKVIMTTALGDPLNVMSAYHNLCDAYLVKPIDKVKLLEELKRLALI